MCDRERATAWRLSNLERKRAANARWRAENPEKARESVRSHCRRNKGKVAAKTRRQQAARIQRSPSWSDRQSLELFYAVAHIARLTFPELNPQVDHVIPLNGDRVSGLHVHTNLSVIPGVKNLLKSNRFN